MSLLGTGEIFDGMVEMLFVDMRFVGDALLQLPHGGIFGHGL